MHRRSIPWLDGIFVELPLHLGAKTMISCRFSVEAIRRLRGGSFAANVVVEPPDMVIWPTKVGVATNRNRVATGTGLQRLKNSIYDHNEISPATSWEVSRNLTELESGNWGDRTIDSWEWFTRQSGEGLARSNVWTIPNCWTVLHWKMIASLHWLNWTSAGAPQIWWENLEKKHGSSTQSYQGAASARLVRDALWQPRVPCRPGFPGPFLKIWWFPKIGVPPNHLFKWDFPL